MLAAIKLAIELYSEVLVAVDDLKYVALKEELGRRFVACGREVQHFALARVESHAVGQAPAVDAVASCGRVGEVARPMM